MSHTADIVQPASRSPVWRALKRRARLPSRLDGSGGVWLTAGTLALVLTGLVVWQLAIPREYFTGTNSVGVRSVVANLDVGQRLCVPGLNLPARTGRIQFAVFAHRPTFTAEIQVITREGTSASQMVGAPGPTSLVYASAPIRTQPSSPASVPATACIAPRDGPIALGGMIGLQANQAPALLDGAPLSSRVGVWFLPPPRDKRSLFASLGLVFSRAALFRPGIVGAWTYPVLLFAVLPLMWSLSLLLLARAAARRVLRVGRRAIRPGLAITLVACVNAASWALITPAFNAPDEPDHFAYAQYFAETGHAPSRTPDPRPPYSTDQSMALSAVDVYSQVALTDARPPWLGVNQARWEHERSISPHPADNGGGANAASSSHQPAYYALLAPAYDAVNSQSPFSQLTAARLVSALLGAIVAACAFGVVRELLPRQPVAAVAAGLLVAFQPMFGFISGAVNNDNGINAVAAVSLYLLIRGLRRGLTWRLAAAVGGSLALAPLMKGTGYEIYPAAVVGLLGIAWGQLRMRRVADANRRRRVELRALKSVSLTPWAALVAAFVAVRGGWKLLQPVFYPTIAGHSTNTGHVSATSALTLAEHMPGRFLVYLWELFLPRLSFMGELFPPGAWPFESIYIIRGWGAFGWYAWSFPNWTYEVIIFVMAIVGLLGFATVVRSWRVLRAHFFEALVIVLFPACVLVAVEAAFFTPSGGRTVVAEQGRYIFPAIAALATIAVAGTFGLGRRWHVPLATALVVAMLGLSYASQLLTLGSFYT